MASAVDYGCVLLRFHFPDAPAGCKDFHVELRKLGTNRIQNILSLLSKMWGVPVLLEPNFKLPLNPPPAVTHRLAA